MQTFQQYFYENKTILSHIMESRSGKWVIFIKFASSFEVLSFSIRFFAKFGRHFVSYLFGKPLAYRRRAAGIVIWARPSLVLQTAFRCAKKFLQIISVKISEFFSFSPRV